MYSWRISFIRFREYIQIKGLQMEAENRFMQEKKFI